MSICQLSTPRAGFMGAGRLHYLVKVLNRIIVSTKIDQSHEFWLYYLKYDPQKYLTEGGTVSGGYLEDKNKFDKYFFKPIDFDKQQKEAKTLFVGLPSEFPSNIKILKIVYYLNGEPAIYIVSS